MAAEVATRSRPLLWIALVAAGLLALGLFAAYGLEWVEQSIDLGYGEEALRNRYLAAERFLHEQGVESETVSGMGILESLPPADDTLVITPTRRAMSERRVVSLIRWVEGGGHLVVVAREHWDAESESSRDPLLDHFGVHLLETAAEEAEEGEDEGADDQGEGAEDEGEEYAGESAEEIEQTVSDIITDTLSGELPGCWEDEGRLATLLYRDESEPVELELDRPHHLLDAGGEESMVAQGESGAQLVHIPAGEGRLTVATSLNIWTNHRIHCRDHAYLLWLLSLRSDKVWLLHDPEIPSLATLLAAKLPLTGAGVAVLLLVWAAAKSLRFGPMEPDAEGERRELLEHLEASAHFLWRCDLLGGALDELREELALRAAARHRSWPRLDTAQRIRHLAELAQLPEAEVRLAFTRTPPLPRREFVHIMQTLNAIRRQL